jgi:hypothetical protein
MGQQELRNRRSDLLVRKSQLQRELARRKELEAGIRRINDEPILPRSRSRIEADLTLIENELADIKAGLSEGPQPPSPKGSLTEAVQDWAESEGFEQGKSVPSPKIAKFVRDNLDKFPNITDGSVRSTLSRLGYSTEKNNPET